MSRRSTPERTAGTPPAVGGPAPHGAPMSAAAFRHLVDDAAPMLADLQVSAFFASTVGAPRSPGPTWISVTSRWAYGRLVRDADGSFVCSAHRGVDGASLREVRGTDVTRRDLDALIAVVGGPDRSSGATTSTTPLPVP